MKKEYKVFEGGTIKEIWQQCLRDGFTPLNMKDTYDYCKENKGVDYYWFDTSTTFMNGVWRDMTKAEINDLKSFYANGGRSWFLYNFDGRSTASGDISIGIDNYGGRLVGVRVKK